MPNNHQSKSAQRGPHLPVLLTAVLSVLDPQIGETYLDLTAGYGGHAQAVLARTKNPAGSVLVDRDRTAVARLRSQFKAPPPQVVDNDFLTACRSLSEQGREFDLILADLGASSPHFDQADRGFSFHNDGPLDMRMDQRQTLTAAAIVNEWDEADIVKVLRDFGEEPKARAIARRIVAARPIKSTSELADVASRSWRGLSRTHPATRTFQALRIAVNSELEQLEQALPLVEGMLTPGGRLAVISFHSLEDRIVKRFLAEEAGGNYDSPLRLLTRKPITPPPDELVSNPRARSAKLRAAAKIKTNRKD